MRIGLASGLPLARDNAFWGGSRGCGTTRLLPCTQAQSPKFTEIATCCPGAHKTMHYRFWATADTIPVWDAVIDLGVDLVNVDALEPFRTWAFGEWSPKTATMASKM